MLVNRSIWYRVSTAFDEGLRELALAFLPCMVVGMLGLPRVQISSSRGRTSMTSWLLGTRGEVHCPVRILQRTQRCCPLDGMRILGRGSVFSTWAVKGNMGVDVEAGDPTLRWQGTQHRGGFPDVPLSLAINFTEHQPCGYLRW